MNSGCNHITTEAEPPRVPIMIYAIERPLKQAGTTALCCTATFVDFHTWQHVKALNKFFHGKEFTAQRVFLYIGWDTQNLGKWVASTWQHDQKTRETNIDTKNDGLENISPFIDMAILGYLWILFFQCLFFDSTWGPIKFFAPSSFSLSQPSCWDACSISRGQGPLVFQQYDTVDGWNPAPVDMVNYMVNIPLYPINL